MIDGTTLTVPDNPRMLTRFRKQRGNHGGTTYQARGPNIDRTGYKATLTIDILTPTDS